jgi:hypothetical protein
MKLRTSLLTLIVLVATAAVAHAQRRPSHGWDPKGWQLLGETTIWGKKAKDTIHVGAYEGKFDEISLVVLDADVEVTKLVVHFANREKFAPTLQHYFREGTRSRAIELPGRDRRIQKIEVSYRKLDRRGRATVQIYGRDRRDHGRGHGHGGGGRRWDSTGWERLAELQVDRRRDHDTLRFTRYDGRFSKLTLSVEDADVEIYDMVVTFTNGETFSPKLRLRFREGSSTGVIDLPGDARMIRTIDFRYGNVSRRDRATVVVWGLPARAGRGGGGDRGWSWDSRGWTLLGEQTVDGRVDRDTIRVGRREGTFSKLMLVVLDADVEILEMTVHFRDGKSALMPVRQVFREDTRTRAIDLPGRAQVITKIDMTYRNVSRGGRARVQVHGR